MGLFQIIVYGYLQFMLQVLGLIVLEYYVQSKRRTGFWSNFLEQNQEKSQMFMSKKTLRKLGENLMYKETSSGVISKAPEPVPYI